MLFLLHILISFLILCLKKPVVKGWSCWNYVNVLIIWYTSFIMFYFTNTRYFLLSEARIKSRSAWLLLILNTKASNLNKGFFFFLARCIAWEFTRCVMILLKFQFRTGKGFLWLFLLLVSTVTLAFIL